MSAIGRHHNAHSPRTVQQLPDVTTKSGGQLRNMFRIVAAGSGLDDSMRGVDSLLKDTRFAVVKDGTLSSDAAYDAERGVVLIPESMAADLQALRHKLFSFKKGARKNKTTLEAALRDRNTISKRDSQKFHKLASRIALVVHEAKHAQQHESGSLANLGAALQEAYQRGGQQAVAEEYTRLVEMPAQVLQERAQFALREAPEKSRWQTIDSKGNPLSESEIIRRMMAARPELVESAMAELERSGGTSSTDAAVDPEGRHWGGGIDEGRHWGGGFEQGRHWGGDLDQGRHWGGGLEQGRHWGGDLDEGRHWGGDLGT